MPHVLGGIGALCGRPLPRVVTLNGEIWEDSTPARYEDLPLPDPDYVREFIAPGFARLGIVSVAQRAI